MARLSWNKTTLSKQAKLLKAYEEFLPSLDLKRQQLMLEQSKARREVMDLERAYGSLAAQVGVSCPMLSNSRVDLSGLVTVRGVEIDTENILGARLPVLRAVHLEVRSYAFLGKPHWVDNVVDDLRHALALHVRLQVARRRLGLLGIAVRVVTQRVNLFDKVLIPRAQGNIKSIRIHLADQERAQVVTSKLAKAKKGAAS